MKTSIQTVNVAIEKEEVVMLLQEMQQLTAKLSDEEKESFLMVEKLKGHLNTSLGKNEIAVQATSFKMTAKG